jgi:hypothetical protein
MNKTIILTAIITALVVFVLTLIVFNGMYQGYNAQHWYETMVNAETLRQADFRAITCVRGLGYTNFPNIGWYYRIPNPSLLDSAGNYYSKEAVDTCLFGL